MIISHHPANELLSSYAAGTLDQGQHLAVATHLVGCMICRQWVQDAESIGGVVLSDLTPAPMSPGALDSALSRLNQAVPPPQSPARTSGGLSDVPGLPPYARRLRAREWKWLAPKLWLRRITLEHGGKTRVFLLKAAAGITLLPHAHTGTEMTCVLSGSFSHDGTLYAAGDFDLGDETNEHHIAIGSEEDCICLVAMHGELKMKGVLGRIMQPFTAL
jgi:putative transcriptional regulator